MGWVSSRWEPGSPNITLKLLLPPCVKSLCELNHCPGQVWAGTGGFYRHRLCSSRPGLSCVQLVLHTWDGLIRSCVWIGGVSTNKKRFGLLEWSTWTPEHQVGGQAAHRIFLEHKEPTWGCARKRWPRWCNEEELVVNDPDFLSFCSTRIFSQYPLQNKDLCWLQWDLDEQFSIRKEQHL